MCINVLPSEVYQQSYEVSVAAVFLQVKRL